VREAFTYTEQESALGKTLSKKNKKEHEVSFYLHKQEISRGDPLPKQKKHALSFFPITIL
jgi:hypothetical protein